MKHQIEVDTAGRSAAEPLTPHAEYGYCAECGRRLRLRKDGMLRHHVDMRRPDPNGQWLGWHALCAGVGIAPSAVSS